MSSPASLLSMSTLPFKSPILLTAKRSSGFVDIPTYNDNGIEEWNSAMGVLPPGDDSFSDFANLDGSKGVFAGPTHLNRTRTMGGNIVVLEPDGEPPQAFWLQRKIGLSSHGVIRLGYKLRRNTKASFKGPSNAWQLDMNEEGETSLVKITIMHSSILDMKVDCHEGQNPLNELSALQMIANHSNIEDAHVVGTRLVGTCTSYVYSVLPYYPDGTLLHYCVSKGNLEEPVARFLFKQILQGLKTLQAVGLCHRNLSLDSIDLNGDIAIINGLGWCLRFNKIAPIGTDKSLLVPGGDNSQFVAPEYFGRLDGSWNGFAADNWATGLILYSMVVGTEALFAAPVEEDKRFVALCIKGAIRESAEKYAKSVQREAVLSDELVTLLEKMLQADPEKRYSLDEVLEHPWVANEHLVAPSTREKIRMRDSVSAIYQGNS